jgi:hypothetical protein
VPGTETAQVPATTAAVQAFQDQLSDHGNIIGVRAHGCRSNKIESDLIALLPQFHIQIVEDLHMIGDEADGRNHQVSNPSSAQIDGQIAHIRFQPGLMGRPTATLVGEMPVIPLDGLGDEACALS